MGKIKLDEKDFKLLNKLYHSYRKPVSKIAKELQFSREQVSYRIEKYLSEGLITRFIGFFDYSKLGYNYMAALFVEFGDKGQVKRYHDYLKKSLNCVSWGYVYGKYDVWANLVFENEQKFQEFLSDVSAKFGVSNYEILKPYFLEQFPLKFFDSKEKEMVMEPNSEKQEVELDKTDKVILKEISKNSRAKLVDIAGKAVISSELALHRLKRLEKEGVILGSRIQFDMSKLDYHFSQIFLHIKNFSNENKEKIKKFAKNSKYAHNLMFCLSKPNCVVQLFHQDQSELKEAVNEIKKVFPEEILDLDFMFIGEDVEPIRSLPFY